MSSGSSSSSLASGDISIMLTSFFQRDFVINSHTGFRMRVVAAGAVGVDNEVFRYYLKPPNAHTGVADSVFSGVCTWTDMEDLPVVVPEEGSDPQSFRLAEIDLVVDRESLAQQIWARVQQEVQELLNTIHDGQILDQGEIIEISAISAHAPLGASQLSAVGDVS